MRGCGDAEDDNEEHDAGTPLFPRSLHGVCDTDACVNAAKDAEGGKDFGTGRNAGLEDGR